MEVNFGTDMVATMCAGVEGFSLIRKSCLICVEMIFWLVVEIRIRFWPRQSHFRSFEAVQSESLGEDDRDAVITCFYYPIDCKSKV